MGSGICAWTGLGMVSEQLGISVAAEYLLVLYPVVRILLESGKASSGQRSSDTGLWSADYRTYDSFFVGGSGNIRYINIFRNRYAFDDTTGQTDSRSTEAYECNHRKCCGVGLQSGSICHNKKCKQGKSGL